MRKILHCSAMLMLAFVLVVFAGQVALSEELTGKPAVELPNRWVLIACGLPGDDVHRPRLTEACRQIMAGAQSVLGAKPEQIRVLAGDEAMRKELATDAIDVGVCTKDSMPKTLAELGKLAKQEDGCWVFLLGHSHLYGLESQFNVSGPDFHQEEFAQWAESLHCQEQVFWLTMPVSGFWIKPLANDSRVIITATEADLEFTGTEMPYVLGNHLTAGGEYYQLEDVDEDGTLSLLDLYLGVNLEIDATFKTLDRLQTEHAQLEDNGDGRGKEVQQTYLPVIEEEPEEAEQADEPTDEEASDEDEADDEEEEELAEETPINPFGVRPQVTTRFESNMDGYRAQRILLRSPQ